MSFCNPTYTVSHALGIYKAIPRLILAALMFILAVARFCTESFQTYKATRQWQVNKYLNLLVKEGVLYFLSYVTSPLLHISYLIPSPSECKPRIRLVNFR
ncbi:hypothetical protein J3R83DRAFT_13961 [Lanmaoa asiatica]|nr:hypothetical protein J3R83DRAFT_13961 [Lanmaoa asiatica]